MGACGGESSQGVGSSVLSRPSRRQNPRAAQGRVDRWWREARIPGLSSATVTSWGTKLPSKRQVPSSALRSEGTADRAVCVGGGGALTGASVCVFVCIIPGWGHGCRSWSEKPGPAYSDLCCAHRGPRTGPHPSAVDKRAGLPGAETHSGELGRAWPWRGSEDDGAGAGVARDGRLWKQGLSRAGEQKGRRVAWSLEQLFEGQVHTGRQPHL